MKTVSLALPTLGFVVATRGALGVGIGLLLAGRLTPARRTKLGAVLFAVGAATTLPAAWAVVRGVRRNGDGMARNDELVGATRFARKGDEPVNDDAIRSYEFDNLE